MRRFILTLLITAASATLAAQQVPPTMVHPEQTPAPSTAPPGQRTPTPPVAQAPTAPLRPPSLNAPALRYANVRLAITITDTYAGSPQKKTVTMTLLSGHEGMVRTSNNVRVPGEGYARVQLNVDAMATAYETGAISTRLTVNYSPAPRGTNESGSAPPPGTLEESIVAVLVDGKPMLLTESADPHTDRKVTLEATATILK